MSSFTAQYLPSHAVSRPNAPALLWKEQVISYNQLLDAVEAFCQLLSALDIKKGGRVAVYLPKQPECIIAMLGANLYGAVFVPINPQLKPHQVGHILQNCSVSLLISSGQRINMLEKEFGNQIPAQVLTLEPSAHADWHSSLSASRTHGTNRPCSADACWVPDLAAILYTSGSTGMPKGVMISNSNLAAGAKSVSQYLSNTESDRILCLLPLSFDYGLSQLTTALLTGASAVLLDYLLPGDVLKACEHYGITGLAAVPPLWSKLALLQWPETVKRQLRYITNSGGAMPESVLTRIQQQLPQTKPFMMYGLTEAFRSTFLAPERITRKPTSIGRAIPDAKIVVIKPDGTRAKAHEQGELVHLGPHVAMGYWQEPALSAKKFRPLPGEQEIAVWSGDRVYFDEEGDLFFVARDDEMIKSSGYRISPTEIEQVCYAIESVKAAVALGIPDDALGEKIVLVLSLTDNDQLEQIKRHLRKQLPQFMQVHHFVLRNELPQNANGKIDRSGISESVKQQAAGYHYA